MESCPAAATTAGEPKGRSRQYEAQSLLAIPSTMDSEPGVHRVQHGDARRFVRWEHVAARWAGLLALVAASSVFVGCAAEAEVAPAPAVPVDYYYYPYTYYDGHIVYYVDGSWYYPY